MREVRVLLTCIGGRFSRDIIRLLKENRNPKITVVGVDTNPDVAAKGELESFYTVPRGTDSKYVPQILEICKKESIGIVIPCADEEVLAISRKKKVFDDEGIICAVDDIRTIFLTSDKWKLFEHLSRLNIPMPKYRLVHNIQDIRDSADYFGYPENKFVLKPPIGRGTRNVWIIGKDCEGEYSLDKLYTIFEEKKPKKFGYLAMEYLPGPAYDVDVLAKEGKSICTVPRRREWKNKLSPYSQGCIVEKNTDPMNFVKTIVALLNLNYVYDFDCGTTADGRSAIYEINPRFSGAIAASAAAGANIPVMLVRMLLGMDLPKCNIRFGTRMRPGPDGEMKFSYGEEYAYKGTT